MIEKIVIAADENYVIGTLALIASIGKNTDRAIRDRLRLVFAYENESISERSKRLIQESASRFELDLHTESFVPGSKKSKRHISTTTFAKFYFLDNSDEPFLWLDTDTIVLPGWSEILESDQYMSSNKPYLIVKRPDGSSSNPNAGVFGAFPGNPIENWESRVGVHELSLEQHIFQAELPPRSFAADSSFNVISIWGQPTDSSAKIRHFAGPIKPWHQSKRASQKCIDAQCAWASWHEVYGEQPSLSGSAITSEMRKATKSSLGMRHRVLLSSVAFAASFENVAWTGRALAKIANLSGLRGELHPLHRYRDN